MSNVLVGVERPFIRDIKEEIVDKASIGADYFVAPLFHPRLRRDANEISGNRLGAVTRSDRELESRQWITNIVGKISDWIDLDNSDVNVRKSSLQALQQETAWAAHLSLQAILIPSPRLYSTNYARAMLQAFTGYQQIYVRIPLIPPLSMHYQQSPTNVTTTEPEDANEYCKDGWLVWDGFRQNLGDFTRFFVALELTPECEDIDFTTPAGQAFIQRWCAEPVKLILLPVTMFLTNNAGFPVLSKNLQHIFRVLLPHCTQIVLTGPSSSGTYTHHAQYLRHLKNRDIQALSEAEKYVLGYEDTLQAPLQPLMDNLEAQTYETFERDPTKYIQYEKAITRALLMLSEKRAKEGIDSSNSNSSILNNAADTASTTSESPTLVLTVVGAGRGPLVAAAISASSATAVSVRVYAVEKNANAVITLRNRVLSEFWTNVTVIASDMRDWTPPEQCDIMISELLGSFGDNELSPECLDGAQKCLKPDGLSIPYNYTSYIAPIATSKLWNMAKGFNLSNSIISNGLDTAYVVRFKSAYQFDTAQSLFAFEHPNRSAKIDNTRYDSRSFVSATDMVMHGIAGYFESVLFSKELYDKSISGGISGDIASAGGDGSYDSNGFDFTPTSPRSPRTPVRGAQRDARSGGSVTGGVSNSGGISGESGGQVRPRSPAVPPPPGGLTISTNTSTNITSGGVVDNSSSVEMTESADVTSFNTSSSLSGASEEEVVMLSIVPQTHTPGMQSWFPLFIPLAQPIRVKRGDVITVHIWRCADARKVWYEWCLSSPVRTPVQNSGGKVYSVGL